MMKRWLKPGELDLFTRTLWDGKDKNEKIIRMCVSWGEFLSRISRALIFCKDITSYKVEQMSLAELNGIYSNVELIRGKCDSGKFDNNVREFMARIVPPE